MINFRTTFVNKKGEVVTKSRSIVKHYLKGWFLCDLLAALPFDMLYALNLYSRVRVFGNSCNNVTLCIFQRLAYVFIFLFWAEHFDSHVEIDSVAAFGSSLCQNGPIFSILVHHFDAIDAHVQFVGALACLCLVRDRH